MILLFIVCHFYVAFMSLPSAPPSRTRSPRHCSSLSYVLCYVMLLYVSFALCFILCYCMLCFVLVYGLLYFMFYFMSPSRTRSPRHCSSPVIVIIIISCFIIIIIIIIIISSSSIIVPHRARPAKRICHCYYHHYLY